MRISSVILLVVALCLMTAQVCAEGGAAAPAPVEKAQKKVFDWGGDIRLRSENFNDIPINDDAKVSRGGRNIYFRGRTRIWGQVFFSDYVEFKARLVNEFRSYQSESGKNTYPWPDEFVFDNLYLDFKNLLDQKLDLRVGRQELIYGNGRVILEGNPLDGSRTIYFNAVKASLKLGGAKNTILDFLGIYNKAIDELAINSKKRHLIGILPPFPEDMVEWGAGIYGKNKSIQKMPFEFYYLFKNESDYAPAPPGGQVPGDLDLHTLGFRLMPIFTESLTGNLEAAGQFGERGGQDVSGWMVDAKLSYTFQASEKIKPSASVGLYYLSGDDPDTADDEGWNPLWARYPQQSELYVYAWDADGAGRWSNLTMPYVALDVPFTPKLLFSILGGPMFAPEEDGPGGGDERGELVTAWLKFKLNDTWSGHLLGEFVFPGNYYQVSDTGYFARAEMMCIF